MKRKIDGLLSEGKFDEADPLIKAVWAKEAAQTEKKIADLNRRLEAFEKLQQSRRSS